jgi:hypothetical protein
VGDTGFELRILFPTDTPVIEDTAKQTAWGGVGGTQKADLAELADGVEGLRTPHASKARSR